MVKVLGLILILTVVFFLALLVEADDSGLIVTDLSKINQQIILDIRLPRLISALVCGASLALAGAMLQSLLQNPLADPFVLGVSGGGSVAAILSMLLGLAGIWILPGAFVGALLSLLLVYALANKASSGFAFRLILSGIILASAWTALVNFLLITSPASKLPGIVFWLMGDLGNLEIPWFTIGVLVFSLMAGLFLAKDMDLLIYGDNFAHSLGLAISRVQWYILLISSALTASVVSVAGNIGFVGLVVPHIIRLAGAKNHRQLLPQSALLGASLLILADWSARIVWAPHILPVGILTTVIGVPLFIYLLRRTND